jgi:small-conductance mechanosensitive channel
MMTRHRRCLFPLLFSGVVLALTSTAQAQFNGYNPAAAAPYAQTQAAAAVAAAPAGFGYAPYAGTYVQSPIGGYMSGQADIINAGGQYRVSTQQANLLQEQLNQKRIDTKRKQFDEAAYERSMTPPPSVLREEKRVEQLRYYRDNPAPNDVWSGISLNAMLEDIQKVERETNLRGPVVPIDQKLLQSINLAGASRSDSDGTAGVLRDGNLQWPLNLKRAKYKKDREELQGLVTKLIRQAQVNDIDPDTLDAANKTTDTMRDALTTTISEIGPSEYIKSSEYLRQVKSSLKLFSEPNAASHFNGVFAAKGQTVGELIWNMTRGGMTFAKAAPGDEQSYNVLQQALAAYDLGLERMATRSLATLPPPSSPR